MIHSEEVKRKAVELYRQTHSMASVSRTVGAAVSTVREWVIQAGAYEPRGTTGAPIDEACLVDVGTELDGGSNPLRVASRLRGPDSARWRLLGQSCGLMSGHLEDWQYGELLRSVAKGAAVEVAAAQCGIRPQLLSEWRERAEADEEPWASGWALLRSALGASAASLLDQIKLGGGGWSGPAWMLSHQGWESYTPKGRDVDVHVSGLRERSDEEILDIVRRSLEPAGQHGGEIKEVIAPLDEIMYGGSDGE